MRGPLRVFRDLTSVDGRLGFYTLETKEMIPEQPGCYAWFLPLWLYKRDLGGLMKMVSEIFGYERQPEKLVSADFSWHSISMRVRPQKIVRPTGDDLTGTWDRILADDDARAALEQMMMEASLFMPPLYVGRTANLKGRYQQHLTEKRGRNDFHNRFSECMNNTDVKLQVSDLLFVCVKTRDELNQELDRFDKVELLVEQVLMQFCRPPFSLK